MDENIKKLKLNNKIDIINQDEKKTQGTIYDILQDKIIVSVSSDDKDFKLLQIGEEVNCIAYDKKNTLGFYGIIQDRRYEDMSNYVIADLKGFQKIQRRQDVRIPLSIEILYTDNSFLVKAYGKIKKEEILKSGDRYLREGIIINLSAGGVKFTCYDNFFQGSKLLLSFQLGKNKYITKAIILHKEIKIVSNKTSYTYGAKFKDLSEENREMIIRHIFKIMRKKMKK